MKRETDAKESLCGITMYPMYATKKCSWSSATTAAAADYFNSYVLSYDVRCNHFLVKFYDIRYREN